MKPATPTPAVVNPVEPVEPVQPTKPAEPVQPVAPVEPATPAAPAEPTVVQDYTDKLYYTEDTRQLFTGKAVLLHANGQKLFEGTFQNGVRHGEGTEWYANGKVKYEGTFNGERLLTGKAYWYYADSLALKLRAEYVEGRMVDAVHLSRLGSANP